MSTPDALLEVHSMTTIQRLYEAAVRVSHQPRDAAAQAALAYAITDLEHHAVQGAMLEDVTELARQRYEKLADGCNIEIDDLGLTHPSGTGGYWVAAWLWVSQDDLNDHYAAEAAASVEGAPA